MRQVTLGRDGIDELFTVQKPGTPMPHFKIDKKKKPQNTYFLPSTRDFAFPSKVHRRRFISDSGTRTALLTVGGNTEGLEVGAGEGDVE